MRFSQPNFLLLAAFFMLLALSPSFNPLSGEVESSGLRLVSAMDDASGEPAGDGITQDQEEVIELSDDEPEPEPDAPSGESDDEGGTSSSGDEGDDAAAAAAPQGSSSQEDAPAAAPQSKKKVSLPSKKVIGAAFVGASGAAFLARGMLNR